MFFSQHVKQGREVGAEGLKLLKNCFEGTRYVQGDDFNPPHDLFDDLYIRGYFTSYFGYIKDFAYGGETWSSQRKGEFAQEAMLSIDPSGKFLKHHLNMAQSQKNMEETMSSREFGEGNNAAITLVGSSYNRLLPDDPDPILAEARTLAKKLANAAGQDGALGAAIVMITIRSYVSSKWSDDDC